MGAETAAKAVTTTEGAVFVLWDSINSEGKNGLSDMEKKEFIEVWTAFFTMYPPDSVKLFAIMGLIAVHAQAIIPRGKDSYSAYKKYKDKKETDSKHRKTTKEIADDKRKSIAARVDDKESKTGTDPKRIENISDEGKSEPTGGRDKTGTLPDGTKETTFSSGIDEVTSIPSGGGVLKEAKISEKPKDGNKADDGRIDW